LRIDGQEAQRAIVPLIDVVLPLTDELETSLNLMASMGIDQVVFKLTLGVVEHLDQIAQPKTRCAAVYTLDVDFQQTRSLLISAGDAELFTYIPQRRRRGIALIESHR